MVEQIRQAVTSIKEEKGPIALFLLIKNNSFLEDWSIVFSALWADHQKGEDVFVFIATKLRQFLEEGDLRKITRIELVPSADERVLSINSVFSVDGGIWHLKNNQINSFFIEEGVLFESVRVPASDAVRLTDVPKKALITCDGSSLYWYSADGRRYVFPNSRTYETWFPRDGVQPKIYRIPTEELARIPIAGNVTYKPGIRMIKAKEDPKIYAVSLGGVIRHIENTAVIEEIYGKDWLSKLDTVPDAFFVNYSLGDSIKSSSDYSPIRESESAKTVEDTISFWHHQRRADRSVTQSS